MVRIQDRLKVLLNKTASNVVFSLAKPPTPTYSQTPTITYSVTPTIELLQGTLSGECPGGSYPCTFELATAQGTASISCDAFGVSLTWSGSSWAVSSAPCGPHDSTGGSFDQAAKTMSASFYDNGCTCNWSVTVP